MPPESVTLNAGRRWLLIGFGALGLAAASTSSYVHHRLLTDPGYTSACDINAKVSCTQAYLSPYGSLFGVPVALFGVMYFVVVLLLAGLGGRERSDVRDTVPAYLAAWSAIGLAFVAYLAWASYLQLGTFCILCAVTYVSVIAIFVVSNKGSRTALKTLPRGATRDLGTLARSPLALLVLVLLIGGAAAVIGFFPKEATAVAQAPAYPPLTDQQRTDLEKWWAVQPKVDIPIPNNGAKVLIVKFSDYMCPACRQTYEQYKPVLGKYLSGGEVRYVVKHYPLEAECNKNAASNHYASCEAAAAVIMARSKGTAQNLEQWIFSNQDGLTADAVKKAAKDIGNIEDFDAQYPRVLEEVKTDAGLGGLLGVNRTPTFYIAGRKVPNDTILPPQYFDYLIELALKTP
jgi:uncharacterized membrane protein/protein-disulfide isomerase